MRYRRGDPLLVPLTIDQAAARVGRSRRTIERWLRLGLVHPVVIDGVRMFVWREVVEAEYRQRMARRRRVS